MAGIVFAQKVTTWGMTNAALIANNADFGHVEAERVELAKIRDEVDPLGNEQIALQAKLSQVTRDLEELFKKGDALHARLRAAVKAKYGYKSEKLQEFQLQPYRRRVRGAVTEEKKTPKAPAPDPAYTA
jgi:hypothetical protein